MDLKNVYTQILMEHARSSDYKHDLNNPDFEERGHNPSCGDDIKIQVKISEGIIKEVAFTGQGCAISQASTSMMCQLMEGKSLNEAKQDIEMFLAMIRGDKKDPEELEELGDAISLMDISHMPQRVKCAVLAWRTLDNILEKAGDQ